jgi:hypothetical protein
VSEPSWYRAWREDAFDQLLEKNRQLEAEFRLGHWERWDYRLDDATLVFSQDGKPQVTTAIQVVGSVVLRSGSWLWAWANQSLPDRVVEDAAASRRFGAQHAIAELTTERMEEGSLVELGWELAAVTARIAQSRGAYRAPTKNGYLFLVFRDLALVS